MAVLGLDHVQVAMPPGQEEEADAFYAGLLGLMRLAKPAPLAARGGCWFQAGSAQVHLGVEADFRPAAKAHPALVVDDLDEVVERLTAAGVRFRWDEELPGVRRGFTADPFGNRIELLAGAG
ncbi:VOC family protein [soil metagenome]